MLFGDLIDEYMTHCHSRGLRPKTMASYEQTLRLFERYLNDQELDTKPRNIKERNINAYIVDLQKRGKYTMCVDDGQMKSNCPMRRRDYRAPISPTTINNYIRNLKAFLIG